MRAPVISEASLFSYLVTRQTGRAVRLSIEDQFAEPAGAVVGVLDFREVAVIDFSCADEVVAKLVDEAQGADTRRFFLFRGLRDHHLDPISSALDRRALAVAAERTDGTRLLVGTVTDDQRRAWREVDRLGRAGAAAVARGIGTSDGRAVEALEALYRRRLVAADGEGYLSLHRMVREARRSRRDD